MTKNMPLVPLVLPERGKVIEIEAAEEPSENDRHLELVMLSEEICKEVLDKTKNIAEALTVAFHVQSNIQIATVSTFNHVVGMPEVAETVNKALKKAKR